MNFSDIFKNQVTLSGWTVIFAGGIFFIAIIILISSVFSLKKKLKYATTPRFGFAGKPIYPLIATIMISISIPLLIYSFTQDTSFVQEASEKVEFNFQYSELGKQGTTTAFQMKLLPKVDGEEYGSKSFDIFWHFIGTEDKNFYEFNKTKDDPSNLFVNLKSGKYQIKILVTYENKTETIEEVLNVE